MEHVSGSILISSLYLFKLSASLDFCLFEIRILEWVVYLGKEGYSMRNKIKINGIEGVKFVSRTIIFFLLENRAIILYLLRLKCKVKLNDLILKYIVVAHDEVGFKSL